MCRNLSKHFHVISDFDCCDIRCPFIHIQATHFHMKHIRKCAVGLSISSWQLYSHRDFPLNRNFPLIISDSLKKKMENWRIIQPNTTSHYIKLSETVTWFSTNRKFGNTFPWFLADFFLTKYSNRTILPLPFPSPTHAEPDNECSIIPLSLHAWL